jgi:hypothetical protein
MTLRFSFLVFCALLLAAPAAVAQSSNDADSTDASDASTSRFDRVDPHNDRLFFKSTARPVGEGRVIVSALNVFLLQVEVGITDAISLEGGVLLLPDYTGDLFTFNPSVRLYNGDRFDVAVDAQAFAFKESDIFLGDGARPVFSIEINEQWRYAVTPRVHVTYGTDIASLTGSVGVPLATRRTKEDISGTGDVVLLLGGDLQVFNWLKVITENDVTLGVPYSVAAPFRDAQGNVDFARERRETAAYQTLSGVRFFWDRFAIDVAAGAVTYGSTDLDLEGTGLLRFSYRF